MTKIRIVTALMTVCFATHAQGLRVVNAASLSAVSLAPGSIITVFGSNLTGSIAVTGNVQTPPTSLGGVSVTIGGSPASLFYVSPTQINAVINPATPAGAQSLAVTSGTGTQTANVTISTTAPPGLFSLSASGTRDGAILNAVTFLLGAFGVTTSNSPTFLALFATGLNTTVAPTVTIGGVSAQVTFYGAAPCCAGLQQINVMVPASLAGAGRVPIVLMSGTTASNTVQVVLLPPASQKEFPDDSEQGDRSRELASVAYVPGTSIVLAADENDDVVRAIDVKSQKVTQVITLSDGSRPGALAVNAGGTLAVVTEAGSGKVAIVDLTKFTVIAELATGPGARRVVVFGTEAIVVNGDNDTVSILNLASNTVLKTLSVGRGPEGVDVDVAAQKAYVANEDDGTVSVIDLNTLAVTATLQLGAAVRPEGIVVIPGTGTAFVTVPAAGPDGQVIELNLATGAQTPISANPDRSGGSSNVVFFHSTLYFANQAGGSISILPLNGTTPGTVTTVQVGLGARALAVDVKDNLLIVTNEGTGTLALIDLATNKLAAKFSAVQTGMPADSESDDHSDRDAAANPPQIQSLSVTSAKAGASLTLTITGTNLTGATGLEFVGPDQKGDDHGKQGSDDFTVTAVHVNAAGTQLTATVAIAASALPGPRLVRVESPNGASTGKMTATDTFVVL